jgi:hypothetical protein
MPLFRCYFWRYSSCALIVVKLAAKKMTAIVAAISAIVTAGEVNNGAEDDAFTMPRGKKSSRII